ncbi:MAG: hypothetical protein M0R03_16795 [Novosphingobium sp.]|nr:hypothetical protein [Novosphingobium sp.]
MKNNLFKDLLKSICQARKIHKTRKFGPPNPIPTPKPRPVYKFDIHGLPIIEKYKEPPKMKRPVSENIEVSNDYLEWVKNGQKHLYILCSAIWVDDKKDYAHQPKNIPSGFAVCGQRHCNCFAILQLIGIPYKNRCIQGFLTSDTRFVDRIEGAKIAFNANQTEEDYGYLQSEDLY